MRADPERENSPQDTELEQAELEEHQPHKNNVEEGDRQGYEHRFYALGVLIKSTLFRRNRWFASFPQSGQPVSLHKIFHITRHFCGLCYGSRLPDQFRRRLRQDDMF